MRQALRISILLLIELPPARSRADHLRPAGAAFGAVIHLIMPDMAAVDAVRHGRAQQFPQQDLAPLRLRSDDRV
jgi:hypothetical protein